MANNPIQVLIEANNGVNFLIEHEGGFVDMYRIDLGQTANERPSPFGRTSISSTSSNPHRLTINGRLRELKCYTQHPAGEYLINLAAQIEEQKYTIADFATITLPRQDGVMVNMRIEACSWQRHRDRAQEVQVNMTWVASDFTGVPDAFTYVKGGLVVG